MNVERKQMLKVLAAVVGVTLLVQAVPAVADAVTLGYDHDGAVIRTYDGGSTSDSINTGALLVNMSYASPTYYQVRRALVAFDMDALTTDGYDPNAHKIDSITLKLTVGNGKGYGGPENTTRVYGISQSAGEWSFVAGDFYKTATELWGIGETVGSMLGSHEFPVSSADAEVNIEIVLAGDLTGLVNGWLATNTGMAIYGYDGEPTSVQKMNYTTTSPQLVVEYSAVPEPATMAMLGLGGVMMLIRRRRNIA